MTDTELYLCIYAYGVLITGWAHVDYMSIGDILASLVAGLLWPVSIPGSILRKIIR